MYFPAYDSPAIQNGFLLYYEKSLKKLIRLCRLSCAVEESVQIKLGSVFFEKPTPAGDQIKSR